MRLSTVALIVTLALAPLAAPLPAGAQQPAKVPRIGLLSPDAPYPTEAFRQGLRELGYVEDQNIAFESRFAEGRYERLPAFAAELVRLKVDVIVTGGTLAIQAAQHATRTIPIVMTNTSDPVAGGFVASLARPGGNITGLSMMSHELVGKQLELLKEVVPRLSRVALLWNPANASNGPQLREAEVAARALKVRLQPLEVRYPEDLDSAFAAMTRERAGGLLVLNDGMLFVH